MTYRSETISNMLRKRLNNTHFLPAIQREFVWSPQQISTLFDSLMRDYPISSFLFWELEPEHHGEWHSYKFIDYASQRGNHNVPLNSTAGLQQLTLVLDGQQRLTALRIGLTGYYETKKPRAHYNNPNAWLKRRLYLDLLRGPQAQEEDGKEGMRYGFAFLADERKSFSSGERYWFKVEHILDTANTDDLEDLIENEQEKLSEGTNRDQRKVLRRNLTRLHEVVWKDDAIWYYTEHEQDFDRVLDIFVRANSGGTTLTKSDLLLSTITAQWTGKHKNAREEIYSFVDRVNGELTRRNNFNKDFVMKTCLVLCDLPVRYRAQNFNNKNLGLIFEQWESIKSAIEAGVNLANHFGIDRDTFLSQNALIPVIYYLHALGGGERLLGSTHFDATNAAAIRRWLTAAMLNNAFGGASDTLLRETRRIIREHMDSGEKDFPVEQLNRRIAELGRSTEFDDALIDEMLSLPYGNRRTFLALTLLYDRKDWGITEFHQDHIFPRALFDEEQLDSAGVLSEKRGTYWELCNRLGNLELLLPNENMEKSAKPFSEWVRTRDVSFKREHLIPEDEDLFTFEFFEEFITSREQLIRERLRKLFQIE